MKNIVLTTGYSLLTAFFLCTPLCAQEKVLDRMTRSEARQEILRHTEIKDHVTFYHSNDKDIYVVYDLISSGNKEKMLQGKTILLGILDAFESTGTNPALWKYLSLPARSFSIPYAYLKKTN